MAPDITMTFRILLLLGALSAFGPMAIDFYLPSFPALAKAFVTDVEHVQLTLASYFIGLAFGQLIYGPLADRFGRRPPLLAGVTIFTLASVACAQAPSLEWLIGARFVQALGGCAGMVVSRAVVRDLCDPIASAKAFSQLMLVMGLAPILAPLGGGLLLELFGWQSIFWGLTLFSTLVLLGIAAWLPETLSSVMPRAPLSGALGQYRRLFGDWQFLVYGMTGGFAIAGMFAYIAGSPFVFIQLYGVPPEHYGWLFGSNAAGFILVAQVNAFLLRHRGPAFWMRRVIWIYLVCALALLVVSSLHTESLWPLLLPLFGCIASLGCILPNASACAMAGQGQNAGSASALMGSLQFGVAAGAAALVGLLHDGSAMPLALVISLCGCAAVVCSLVTRRLDRNGQAPLG
jgi:DHA1 family bicyclomycin/chloramphenicol resistance-like MFS transporter